MKHGSMRIARITGASRSSAFPLPQAADTRWTANRKKATLSSCGRRRANLRPGEIGIFRLPDGEGLIKEYQRDGLHSHNPAFPVRKPQELAGMVCLGHVLGPVEESLLPDPREAALLENAYSAGKLTF